MKKMQKIRKAIFERDETLGVAFTVFAIIFVGAALVTAIFEPGNTSIPVFCLIALYFVLSAAYHLGTLRRKVKQ